MSLVDDLDLVTRSKGLLSLNGPLVTSLPGTDLLPDYVRYVEFVLFGVVNIWHQPGIHHLLPEDLDIDQVRVIVTLQNRGLPALLAHPGLVLVGFVERDGVVDLVNTDQLLPLSLVLDVHQTGSL